MLPDHAPAETDRPLVTVIMPTYNSAPFIAEAIQSVLDQTYRPIHLLIGDDASTDGTADIIRQYARNYPDIIDAHFHPENMGMLDNILLLYPHIKGDYECWFAGDDLYYKDKIATQLKAMKDHEGCVFSFHDVDVVNSAGRFLFRYNDEVLGHKAYTTDVPANLLRYRCFVSGLSIMVDRSKAAGIQHRAEIGPCADWLLFFELATRGSVLYIDRPLGAYRRHGSNITRNADIAWEEKVFRYVDTHYPDYKDDVARGRLVLNLKYIFKYALRKKWAEAFKTMKAFVEIARRHPQAILFMVKNFFAENKKRAYFLIKTGRIAYR